MREAIPLLLDDELTLVFTLTAGNVCALSFCAGLSGAVQHFPRSGTTESKRIPFKIFEMC